MISIDRSILVSDISTRSESVSVLITGSPGAGKSWVCAEIAKALEKKATRLVFAISAEEHAVRSLDDLRVSLGLDTDVVLFLNSVVEGVVLIIDGLDSLRGDPSQNTFRELIRRVFTEAPRCTIVASIRTFDLRRSPEFQRLFFSSDTRNRVTEIAIPELSDEELASVAATEARIGNLITKASSALKSLLRNPFNLTLAASLIGGGTSTSELSTFDSQVQLLNAFWTWRVLASVDSHERLEVLRPLLTRMISTQSLWASTAGMFGPGLGKALSGLLSDEILKENATGRMAFEHNILFDYALSRVLLHDANVLEFINEDPNRTIFYRPSLAYFFYYLWLVDREVFWETGLALVASPTVPERARIIPEITTYAAARNVEDLRRILSPSSATEIKALTGMLRALQTFGGIQGGRRKLWISVLQEVGRNFKIEFVNEFASILHDAVEVASPAETAELLTLAIKFLHWLWDQASNLSVARARSLADFASARVFPTILKNYAVDPDAVKPVVATILSRYKDERSSANEALRLANEINAIVLSDPDTAVAVYASTFGHEEKSRDETLIGNSAVLPLISNRAQDFSTALYTLQAKFKTFLQVEPLHALHAAIDAVNAQVGQKYGSAAGRALPEFTFSYGRDNGVYRADGSEVWDMGGPDLLSLSLLASTISASANKSKGAMPIAELVQVLVKEARYAVTWKRLFTIASTHVSDTFTDLLPLLLIPELISAPEVTIAVGNFISAAFKAGVVSADAEELLEKAIFGIPTASVLIKYEDAESIRNRLLFCIPRASIVSADVQALYDHLIETRKVRENKPYVSYGFSQRAYGTEDYLRDQGADPSLPQNSVALGLLETLQSWESRFLNSVPSVTECDSVRQQLSEMERLLRGRQMQRPVAIAARGAICAVAKVVLKNSKLAKGSAVVVQSRRIVLRGSRDEKPAPNPEQDAKFDLPSWGGGQARIEAAQGVINYLRHWGSDRSIALAFNRLSRDPVPSVRFQIAIGLPILWTRRSPSDFWEMLGRMISAETTTGVMTALANAAGAAASADPDRAATALISAVNRRINENDRSELRRSFLQVFVGLYVARDNALSNEQLKQFEANPVRFEREIAEEVYAASAYIAREGKDNEGMRKRSRELLTRIVKGAFKAIEEFAQRDDPNEGRQEVFTKLMKILDNVATRIFHVLGIDPYSGTESESTSHAWLYWEIKPVLQLLATHESDSRHHFLAPHTANYLMQTFNGIMQFDAPAAIEFAASVCEAAEKTGYQFEMEAVTEMTKLVGRILADHRQLLKDPKIAAAVGKLLDLFASAGWPEVWSLTMRLDDAIR